MVNASNILISQELLLRKHYEEIHDMLDIQKKPLAKNDFKVEVPIEFKNRVKTTIGPKFNPI